MKNIDLDIQPLGERGWLLQVTTEHAMRDQRRLLLLAEQLRKEREVEAAVPGDLSLGLLLHEPDIRQCWPVRLREAFSNIEAQRLQPRLHHLPTVFDGPDLDAVANTCDMSPEGLVQLFVSTRHTVWFTGFLPGFGYLRGLPEVLHLPRREVPRARVPAGSVAIAGAYAAVYPFDSPGGWHLLGHTAFQLFDPGKQPPCALLPGDAVQFEPVRD